MDEPNILKEEEKTSSGNHLTPYLRPQLRLFMTADIIGSTAYKQTRGGGVASKNSSDTSDTPPKLHDLRPDWFDPIEIFYSSTSEILRQEWEKIRSSLGERERPKDSSSPTFWKAIGDELGFTKRIDESVEAIIAITAWRNTLLSLKKILNDYGLDIKSTIWLAGFPVTNTEVIFSLNKNIYAGDNFTSPDDFLYSSLENLENFYAYKDSRDQKNLPNSGWVRDFVGPMIDTGFRISTKATSRKCIISLELAYFLCKYAEKFSQARTTEPDKLNTLAANLVSDINFSGRESFKGVFGGNPYPIFWLDQEKFDNNAIKLNKAEANLLNQKDTLEASTILDFCNGFFDNYAQYCYRPYIDNESMLWGGAPEAHEKKWVKLKKVVEWFDREKIQRAGEVRDISGETIEDGDSTTTVNASTISQMTELLKDDQ